MRFSWCIKACFITFGLFIFVALNIRLEMGKSHRLQGPDEKKTP